MKAKYLIGSALVAIMAAAALAVKRTPELPRFCDQCVMAEETVNWQLAGVTLYSRTTTSETPVSELLRQHQALPPHEHKWSAATVVAEKDLETPNAPRVRSIGLLNAPRTYSFLRSMLEYADARDIASWREVAWEPTLAAALEPALRFGRFPEAGFTTRESFFGWWNEHAYPLFNKLNEMTVAD